MLTRLTLMGMERELNSLTPTKSIGDGITITNEHFDKDTLLATIVNTGGTFAVNYADPEFFHLMCGYFWKKYDRTFNKWFDVFDIEYSPLWNKDYFEETHEDTYDSGHYDKEYGSETVLDDDKSYRDTDTQTVVTDTDTSHSDTRSETTTNTVSAYDSSDWSNHDKSQVSGSESGSGTVDTTETTNDTKQGTSSDDATTTVEGTEAQDDTNDRDFDRSSHQYGNIGIMSSQALIRDEISTQAISIYQKIADLFCQELLICVY